MKRLICLSLAALVLASCGVNYHVRPAGADPARPFASNAAPAKPR